MVPDRESLTVEFKSDRECLSDRELVEAVICLANTEGGSLYIGVEDDGTPTGLHRRHVGKTAGLDALVANRTVPPLHVRISSLDLGGVEIAHIEVPKAQQITASSEGVLKRRRLKADGTPECVPLLPHEFQQRLSQLGLTDPSAQAVSGATLDDLDPAERARLRQFVERFRGDRSLLDLSDDELDGALGLTIRTEAGRHPTLTGLLLIGRESALRSLVPTHEVAFQVRPDYSRSDLHTVVLRLPTADVDIGFLRLVLEEEEKLQGPLPIDSLITLAALREHRRLTRAELARQIQKTDAIALATLERLVERGLVQPHGRGRGRSYTLSAQVYARSANRARKDKRTFEANSPRLFARAGASCTRSNATRNHP